MWVFLFVVLEEIAVKVLTTNRLTAYDDRMVAHAHCGLLFARWAKLMEEYDLVILPTASAPPFDKMAMWAPEVVGGKKMANYFEWISITCELPIFLAFFHTKGMLNPVSLVDFITLTQSPVLALPLGSYLPPIDHLPFGIQVVGRRRKDVELFAVGRAMEAALKGRMEPNLD